MTPEEEIEDRQATAEDQYDSLRVIYKEIIQGYTFDFYSNLYIKHFTEAESIDPVLAKEHFLSQAISKGILSEKEKGKILLESGDWTIEMQEQIDFLSQFIIDNESNLSKIILPEQQLSIKNIIQENREELYVKNLEKKEIFGMTAESYSEKKSSNFLIFNSLFSDKALTCRPYTQDEFDSLDYEELYSYINIYNKIISKFSERNLRKVSVMPFFLNSIAAAVEQPMFFLNKPVTDFTIFQLSIFNRGKRNRFILSNSKGKPPEISPTAKTQDILDWYDCNYSIVMAKFSNDE